MTPASTTNLLRTLFVMFSLCIGLVSGETLYDEPLIGAGLGVALGLTVVLIDRLLKGISLRAFSSATIGLLMGAIFAGLLNSAGVLKYQAEEIQWAAGLACYSIFAYLGMMLAMRSNRDEFSLIIPYVRFSEQAIQGQPVLIDSNVIISGRLKEICDTGFLSGSFLVPEFVVSELQRLADSSDNLKRERGRRGLDHLNQLRRDPKLELTIVESPQAATATVDEALVDLARRISARILTDDTSLTKVARLQGLSVLSFHELTQALRPLLAPGDELELMLVKEGREPHQAVGFLPDGSMIVVNQARKLIGKTARIGILSHVQTSAGRLLFAELRPEDSEELKILPSHPPQAGD